MRRSAKVCLTVVCLAASGIAWLPAATAARATSSAPTAAAVAKPAGYKIATANFSVSSGSETTGSVACPKVAGTQTVPLGGGGLIDGNSLDAYLSSSWPTATGWKTEVSNASGTTTGFSVYAVCADKLPGYAQHKSAAVNNPADAQNGAGYECPKGDSLVGGGVLSSSHSMLVSLNSSFPAGTSIWYVYLNNASPTKATFSVYRICAALNVSSTHYQLVEGTTAVSTPGKQTDVSAFCPDGLSALSGGLVNNSTSLDMTLNTTFPFAGGWGGDENNGSGADANLTAQVLCAS